MEMLDIVVHNLICSLYLLNKFFDLLFMFEVIITIENTFNEIDIQEKRVDAATIFLASEYLEDDASGLW